MLPSPAELTYFLEVADTRNLSRAAERLGVTQPTLSLAMAKLERTFGTQLLLRSRAGVHLTPSGTKFAREARKLLEQWERLRHEAIQDEAEVRGRFTIGCHVSVALYSLHPFLPQVLKRHPGIEVRLVHDHSRKITEAVISHTVDFGIVVNPVKHPDLVIQPLAIDRVCFWRAAGTPSRKLVEPSLLICDPELFQTQELLRKLKRSSQAEIKGVLGTASLEVARSLTAEGTGIGILPTRVAQMDKRLVLAGKEYPHFEDSICLVYRAEGRRSSAGKVLIEAIRGAFQNT